MSGKELSFVLRASIVGLLVFAGTHVWQLGVATTLGLTLLYQELAK